MRVQKMYTFYFTLFYLQTRYYVKKILSFYPNNNKVLIKIIYRIVIT